VLPDTTPHAKPYQGCVSIAQAPHGISALVIYCQCLLQLGNSLHTSAATESRPQHDTFQRDKDVSVHAPC
jgi:hypothetical protein